MFRFFTKGFGCLFAVIIAIICIIAIIVLIHYVSTFDYQGVADDLHNWKNGVENAFKDTQSTTTFAHFF